MSVFDRMLNDKNLGMRARWVFSKFVLSGENWGKYYDSFDEIKEGFCFGTFR